MEGDQRGHSLSVHRQAVTSHPDNRHSIIMIITH